jgi:hypothetical protein
MLRSLFQSQPFDKPALVQLADDTVVQDFFDLNVADFGIITSDEIDERLAAFGDGVDFAPDLEDVNAIGDFE